MTPWQKDGFCKTARHLLFQNFCQPLSVNVATIRAVITIRLLVCRSNNCRTITAYSPLCLLFLFKGTVLWCGFSSTFKCLHGKSLATRWKCWFCCLPLFKYSLYKSLETVLLSVQIAGWSSSGKGLSIPTSQPNRRVVQLWHRLSQYTLHTGHIWSGE